MLAALQQDPTLKYQVHNSRLKTAAVRECVDKHLLYGFRTKSRRRKSHAWEFAYDLCYPCYKDPENDPQNNINPLHWRANQCQRVQCYFCHGIQSAQLSNLKQHLKNHAQECGKEADPTRWYYFHCATGIEYKEIIPKSLFNPNKNYDNVPENPNYDPANDKLDGTQVSDTENDNYNNIVKDHKGQTMTKIQSSSKGYLPVVHARNTVPMALEKVTDKDIKDPVEYIMNECVLVMNALGVTANKINTCSQWGKFCSVCYFIYFTFSIIY